jgi:hypothetical protein
MLIHVNIQSVQKCMYVSLCIGIHMSKSILVYFKIFMSSIYFVYPNLSSISVGSCPNECSGKGTCLTIKDISRFDGPSYDNSIEQSGIYTYIYIYIYVCIYLYTSICK